MPHTIYGDRVGAAFARFAERAGRGSRVSDTLRDSCGTWSVIRTGLLLRPTWRFDTSTMRRTGRAGTGTLNAFRLDQERTEVPIPS